MRNALRYRIMRDFSTMNPDELRGLMAAACEQAALGRVGRTELRGKNLALLCDPDRQACPVLFERAATELGAHVAHLRTGLDGSSSPAQVQETAKVLGRLYDAVECVGMPSDLVLRMGRLAGVPVFEAVSAATHPLAGLADLPGMAGVAVADRRRALVQALLLGVLG